MDPSEILMYENQIRELDLALAADPDNSDLLSLKTEIQELLNLTTSLMESTKSSEKLDNASTSPKGAFISPALDQNDDLSLGNQHNKSIHFDSALLDHPSNIMPTSNHIDTNSNFRSSKWKVGDDCTAKYLQDGRYYPAKIVEALEGNHFKVTFIGYGNTETVSAELIQELKNTKQKPSYIPKDGSTKRSLEASSESADKQPGTQNHKVMKKQLQKSATSEAVLSQKSWLDFSKSKKKKKVGAINTKSIFKSPDSIDGKVGVVGSGRGMTQYAERVKYR